MSNRKYESYSINKLNNMLNDLNMSIYMMSVQQNKKYVDKVIYDSLIYEREKLVEVIKERCGF